MRKEFKVDLLEAVYLDVTAAKGAEPIWRYEVMLTSEGKDPVRIVEREYTTNPWVIARWSKLPGCLYGPGPVQLALPNIKTANVVMEMLLRRSALAVSGMFTVADDGVTNVDNIRIRPGGMIPVKSNGGTSGPSISPLNTGGGFDAGQFMLGEMRDSIRKTLLDYGLPPEKDGVRSATEIVERVRELSRDYGGAYGRLVNELIVPLVRRVIDILYRRGLLPKEIPVDQFAVRVQVSAPLARSQQMQDVESVVRWLEICTAISADPKIAATAKLEEVFIWLGEQLGVPPRLMREKAALKEFLDGLMKQMTGGGQEAGPVPAGDGAMLPQNQMMGV